MCFIIHPYYNRLKTAEDNIICYKQTMRYHDDLIFKSHYCGFIYTRGKDNILNKPLEIFNGEDIEEGFHSFMIPFDKKSTKVFIIPKGAQYYENPGMAQYVSTEIIYTGISVKNKNYLKDVGKFINEYTGNNN